MGVWVGARSRVRRGAACNLAVLDPPGDREDPQLHPPPHRAAQSREGQEQEGATAPCEAPLDLFRVGVRVRVGVRLRLRLSDRVRARVRSQESGVRR